MPYDMTETKMANVMSAVLPFLEKYPGEFEGVFIRSESPKLEIYLFSSQFESKGISAQILDNFVIKGNYDSFHHPLLNSSQYE